MTHLYFEYIPYELNIKIFEKNVYEDSLKYIIKILFPMKKDIYKDIILYEYPDLYKIINTEDNKDISYEKIYTYLKFDDNNNNNNIINEIEMSLKKLYGNSINKYNAGNTKLLEGLNLILKEKDLVMKYLISSKYPDLYNIIKDDKLHWSHNKYLQNIKSGNSGVEVENYATYIYKLNIKYKNNNFYNNLLKEYISNIIIMIIQLNKKDNIWSNDYPNTKFNPIEVYIDLKEQINRISDKDKISSGFITNIKYFILSILILKDENIKLLINNNDTSIAYPTSRLTINKINKYKTESIILYAVYMEIINIFINDYHYDMSDIISEIN